MHYKQRIGIRLKNILRGALFLIIAGIHPLQAQSPAQREYQVKAAFIYNFIQFVEWPLSTFKDNNAPFVIGILGTDPFGPFLNEIVAGEKTMGRPIVVKRYDDVKDIDNCQLLFINGNDAKKAINQVRQQNILTVSDADNFTNEGGIIRFFNENGKIRFEVNVSAAKAANLSISSKLLRVAQVIDK